MKNAAYSMLAVLILVLMGMGAGFAGPGRLFIAQVLPYAAFAVFLLGFCWRVLRWAWTPVPFHIPLTCGQQKSLPWIRSAKLDNPSSCWGVLGRMGLETLLFRSLFRNNRPRLVEGRLTFGESKYLWIGALAFHWSLLLVLLRHLRLLMEPVPAFVNRMEQLDGFFLVGAPHAYISDVVLPGTLIYLLARRFRNPIVRYISLFTDYFALFLLLGIVLSGILMRYATRVDIFGVKQYIMGVASFRPVSTDALSPVFLTHLLLISALAAYFPFSKLMHSGGVFLSPTRNLVNNSRSKRHMNPWNYPVKTHTYAEWEAEFREKIEAAGIPLEAEHAKDARTD